MAIVELRGLTALRQKPAPLSPRVFIQNSPSCRMQLTDRRLYDIYPFGTRYFCTHIHHREKDTFPLQASLLTSYPCFWQRI